MKSNMGIKRVAIGGLLLAFGVLLPRIFHMFADPTLGKMFLPMHLSVFIAGIFLGGTYGLLIGFITPFLNFMVSSMPPYPINTVMAVELAAYGYFSGAFMNHKLLSKVKIFGMDIKIYISLLLSMVLGRVVYGCALFVAAQVFGMKVPQPLSIIVATMTGIPGIVIQFIAVPVIIYALRKAVQEPSMA